MKLTARIAALSVVILFAVFFLLPHSAFAQTYYTNGQQNSLYSNEVDTNVPTDMHSFIQVATIETLSTISCQLAGIDVSHKDQPCLGVDSQTGKIGYVQSNGGLIGMVGQGIIFTVKEPVHLDDYVAYVGNEFGINKAYAATPNTGTGFVSLQPLVGIWASMRNVVYLLFVIIFVIVGLGIMLRIQIDPRTVMTIENQLPKIIIGLILVTFSYAIAGFIIDMMWVLTFFIINVLGNADPLSNKNTVIQAATGYLFDNPIGYVNDVLTNPNVFGGGLIQMSFSAGHNVGSVFQNLFTNGNINSLGIMPPSKDPTSGNTALGCNQDIFILSGLGCAVDTVFNVTTDVVGGILGNIIGWIVAWILGALAAIVVFVAILVVMFRVWFALLKAYAFIIISTIFAPFYIISGAIPGGPGFGGWIKTLISYVIQFPLAVLVFVLIRVLIDSFSAQNGNNTAPAPGASLFVPPLIGNPNANSQDNPLGGLIALGILLALPGILSSAQKAIGGEGAGGLGAAAFAGFAAGGKLLGSSIRHGAGSTLAYRQLTPESQYTKMAGWKGVVGRSAR